MLNLSLRQSWHRPTLRHTCGHTSGWWLAGVLGLLLSMALPATSWAQTISVPLGTAAQFGVLADSALIADDSVLVLGKAGAGNVSGYIRSTSGTYSRSTQMTNALADLLTARSYCTSLTGQLISGNFSGMSLTPGVYDINGDASLDSIGKLVLTGDSTACYVFNISGRLLADSLTTLELQGSLRPDHVYWNVSGSVDLRGARSWQGIVLAGDSVFKTGIKLGDLALLTNGAAVVIQGLDLMIGNNVFASANELAVQLASPQVLCFATPTPNNAAPNWNFTQRMPLCSRDINNIRTDPSAVCNWYSPATLLGTPDYFNICATGTRAGVPSNVFGSQTSMNNSGSYTGLFTLGTVYFPGNNNPAPYREYIQARLAGPLVNNRNYYAEFFVSRAECSVRATQAPGLWLSNDSQVPTGELNAQSIYSIPGQPPIQPQLGQTGPFITSDQTWTRVSGFVPITRPDWNMITIGNFRDNQNTPSQITGTPNCQGNMTFDPYYYCSNVTLWLMPQTPSGYVGCNPQPQIGWATAPSLPVSLQGRVTYQWAVVGTSGHIVGSATQRVITVDQSGSYRLTLYIDNQPFPFLPTPVTIQTPPVVQVTPATTTFCIGSVQPVPLTATSATAGTWQWTQSINGVPFSPITGATASTYTATPPVNQTGTFRYQVKLTTATGCVGLSNIVTITVYPNPAPIPLYASDQTVCEGQTIGLTSDGVGGIGTATYQVSGYAYSGNVLVGTMPTLTVGSVPLYMSVTPSQLIPASATFPCMVTYMLTVTGAGGCTATSLVRVQVDESPTISFSSPNYVFTLAQGGLVEPTVSLGGGWVPGR